MRKRFEWIDIVIKTSVTGIQLSFLLFVLLFVCFGCVCGFKMFLVIVCDFVCMLHVHVKVCVCTSVC